MILRWLTLMLVIWRKCLDDYWFQLRLRFGKRIMYDSQRKIVQISPTQLAKGPCSDQELEAMQFVSKHTTVGLPTVHRVHRLRGQKLFIVMDFVHGDSLDCLWPQLSEEEREEIVRQIWKEMQKLRACQPPSHLDGLVVGSAISGRVVHDGALSLNPVGPFAELHAFEELLRRNPNFNQFSHFWDGSKKEISSTVFVHADISPRNIIIRSSDKAIVIIDWEFAGWWPTYWEVVKWHFSDFPTTPGWTDLMDKNFEMSKSNFCDTEGGNIE